MKRPVMNQPIPFSEAKPAGSQRAFTLIELLVVIAIIGILAAMLLPVIGKAKARAQAAKCQSNLKNVGTAVNVYLGENSEEYPFAGLRFRESGNPADHSYDDLMVGELGSGVKGAEIDSDTPSKKFTPRVILCPSDKVAITNVARVDGQRRSYAMPEHSMGGITIGPVAGNPAEWPPNSQNLTGVGLRWDAQNSVPFGWNLADNINTNRPPRYQFAIVQSMLLAPSQTITFTDRIAPDNIVGGYQDSVISRPNNHIGSVPNAAELLRNHHINEQFNYLYADGHVSLLQREATLSRTNSGAIGTGTTQNGDWTINPKD